MGAKNVRHRCSNEPKMSVSQKRQDMPRVFQKMFECKDVRAKATNCSQNWEQWNWVYLRHWCYRLLDSTLIWKVIQPLFVEKLGTRIQNGRRLHWEGYTPETVKVLLSNWLVKSLIILFIASLLFIKIYSQLACNMAGNWTIYHSKSYVYLVKFVLP